MARNPLKNGLCFICGLPHNSSGRWGKYCKPCAKIAKYRYNKEWQKANKEAYNKNRPGQQRGHMLKLRYGLSVADYEQMLEKQGGVCAICFLPETTIDPRTQRPRNLSVDHCHISGKIRAILCAKCNKGIGAFGDDPAILERAADYLKSHQ